MSLLSISKYFPWSRVVVTGQRVGRESVMTFIRPDRRYSPVCSRCGGNGTVIRSHHSRVVRDLDLGSHRSEIEISYRKVYCSDCDRVVVEDLGVVVPWRRVTRRYALYVYQLCKMMTVSDVSRHLRLDWKTVKDIDRTFLEEDYGETDYSGLRLLAVDEISIRRGHNYMTVVLDYDSGRVVWMGMERRSETLDAFFAGMTQSQRDSIEAVVMDMWDPYIKAVRENLPNAMIVFDLFHAVFAYGIMMDRIRAGEARKASKEDSRVYRGARYLLLSNSVEDGDRRRQLQELLALNEVISIAYILKDKLKRIWLYKRRCYAEKALEEWCNLARSSGNRLLANFAKRLKRHSYGILNHCNYNMHTSRIEGVNNKIKVIKRDAYGYHDPRYFSLKVIQAFAA